ncbi:MAG: squalene--hopene cyclase, partial [Betaproteobacteria bacterium]|nr:squalene--hopene cyclase [Betaproteobacteria bacterium]
MLRPTTGELRFLPDSDPAAPARYRESTTVSPIDGSRLLSAISDARDALLAMQRPDGCWSFVLEADCTIPAGYILMMHFMGEVDELLQQKLARYLREHQEPEGGWTLYPGGGVDLSCTVKCYYALKLAGDSPEAPHMLRACAAILARGGAARSNVFTRIALAMFGQIPWRGVPFIPVEIILLPRWFPFHLSKVSYWSRTVLVPLAILCSLKAQARNPRRVAVRELFTTPPE